ncbi:HET-domain-containing protein [Mycena venus]|uniref:HET-domain-containing protein n=1 Tax=Mycena venus TaxID=2733690 RepID=A0A8H6XHQ0_9AGAR|nr:HET-domain-containing protein [Mycena venus]
MKRPALEWIRRKSTIPSSEDSRLISPSSSEDVVKSDKTAQLVPDIFTLALDLAEQAITIAQVVPFIAPAAILLRKIVDSYEELKSASDKRGVLATYIADLTGDICATVLRTEELNHSDRIGRLKQDLEKYFALIDRGSEFIKTCDQWGNLGRFANRKQLSEEMDKLTRELSSFGARFANNRLVDLYISQAASARVQQEVSETVTQEKLETWLGSPPDMKQMQHDTEKLRTEGTGQWFLQDERFIDWENNAGMLWIEGPSGAGKSVLSSTVIQNLFTDRTLFENEKKMHPAVAFFYFSFRNKDTQNVEIMLRRIILQFSAASPYPYRILNDWYKLSDGQRLPGYQDLVEILKYLLRELGRTYIILDALDECNAGEFDQLVHLVAMLRLWTETPLHLLITSQTRSVFTKAFKGIPQIPLGFKLQQADIERFITSELSTKSELAAWKSQKDKVVNGIARKSNGMFRLASCLLHALALCLYGEPEELDEVLRSLPNDLVTIYDRFMEAIPQRFSFHVEAALRWILFPVESISLAQLADAISFDFTSRDDTYKPSRRAGNQSAIPKWLGGLIVIPQSSNQKMVTLAHASVQDYLCSDHFTKKFSHYDLCDNVSHTFIFRTCISYLLYFGHHPPLDNSLYRDTVKYPLLKYAGTHWYHHLLRSHDLEALLPMALQVLEERSGPYHAVVLSTMKKWHLDLPPLHYCCRKGYLECVRCLVRNGIDLNPVTWLDSPLYLASYFGHFEIVHLLLENGADVNLLCGRHGSALAAASYRCKAEVILLLLQNGANVNLTGGEYGSPLATASYTGKAEIVLLLLENGADVNLVDGKYGSALAAASYSGEAEIVHLLLKNGADINLVGGRYTSALAAASYNGKAEIICLLLENGADVNLAGGDYGSALATASASYRGKPEIIYLILKNGANINLAGGVFGSALAAASYWGRVEIVRLLLENGADVNLGGGKYGGALAAASCGMQLESVRILLENGADVNLAGGDYGSVLAAACACPFSGRRPIQTVRLLLKNGADLESQGARAVEEASKRHDTDLVAFLRRRLDGVVSDADDDTDDEEPSADPDITSDSE